MELTKTSYDDLAYKAYEMMESAVAEKANFMVRSKRFAGYILAAIFFRPFHFLRTSWPVWFYILNRRGRKLYQSHQPHLDDLQQRLLDDLNKDGIAITTLEELFPGENILKTLQTYAEKLIPQATISKSKPFLLRLWKFKEDNCLIDFKNPFVPLALRHKVLDLINSYMGMYSKFHYYTCNITIPMPKGHPPIRSQRWHRDHEDKKMCKMFFYLNDVDSEAGPFTHVLGSPAFNGGKWSKTFSQNPPLGFYPPNGAVEKTIPAEDIKICTAKAGTVVFCDTGGIHFGGYAKSKERLMFTAEYSSQAAFIPLRYDYPLDFEKEYQKLHPAAQFAIDKKLGIGLKVLNAVSRFTIAHRYALYFNLMNK